MRFREVTYRLAVPSRDNGLPLNIALPHMASVRIWQAIHGGYSWAIMYEPGAPNWSDEERKKFVGYSASYRRADQNVSSATIRIAGGPWPTFAAAEQACKSTWRSLRQIN